MSKKIAIIGAGNVGGTLGLGWTKADHQIVFGIRNLDAPETKKLLADAGPSSSAANPSQAAASAEVIVFTVPWAAAKQAAESLGDLTGKVFLDCTNPVKQWPTLDHAGGKSGGEQVAEWLPGARVVKIFNTTGFDNMANPQYGGQALTMFYAGDDAEAKQVAHGLAADLGFEPQDAGPLSVAYHLEVLASLWGTLAYGQKLGRNIGFKLLRR